MLFYSCLWVCTHLAITIMDTKLQLQICRKNYLCLAILWGLSAMTSLYTWVGKFSLTVSPCKSDSFAAIAVRWVSTPPFISSSFWLSLLSESTLRLYHSRSILPPEISEVNINYLSTLLYFFGASISFRAGLYSRPGL